MVRRTLAPVLLGLLLTPTAFAINAPEVDKISEKHLKSNLEFIAHDLLEGRDTPSRGLDIAALFISTQLKIYGVQPGGENGTYLQKMPLESAVLNAENSMLTIDGKSITLGEGFLPTGLTAADVQSTPVFVASGWANVSKGIDPMKGLPLKGAIVITDSALPEGLTMRDATRDPNWESPAVAAKRHGAVAVITIANNPSTASWKRQLDRMVAGGRYAPKSNNPVAALPVVTVTPEIGESLKTAALNAARAEFASAGPTIMLKLDVQRREVITHNVIGIIPGTDPTLSKEFISIGAHYDHVGMSTADGTGDTIFNGADDNGSGTVALLEIARVIATGQRPKRSTLFIWYTGEEKGLWGSQYFCDNPTVDLKQIVFNVNLDMVSMSRPAGDTNPRNEKLAGVNEIHAIGPKLISSQITKTLTEVNNATVKMVLRDDYDRMDDPERIFYRSDHYSFVQKGIPAIFMFCGPHEHYHQRSDEIEVVDFAKLTKSTKLMYGLIYEFASQSNRIVIDGPVKNLFQSGS